MCLAVNDYKKCELNSNHPKKKIKTLHIHSETDKGSGLTWGHDLYVTCNYDNNGNIISLSNTSQSWGAASGSVYCKGSVSININSTEIS